MYLVTGGAGFIGSHIVQRIVTMGERVRVFDDFSSGKRENLRGLENKVEVIFGDLLDEGVVRKAMDGVEVVFHQAALRSVPFSVKCGGNSEHLDCSSGHTGEESGLRLFFLGIRR